MKVKGRHVYQEVVREIDAGDPEMGRVEADSYVGREIRQVLFDHRTGVGGERLEIGVRRWDSAERTGDEDAVRRHLENKAGSGVEMTSVQRGRFGALR